jgi:hypothetical protein
VADEGSEELSGRLIRGHVASLERPDAGSTMREQSRHSFKPLSRQLVADQDFPY